MELNLIYDFLNYLQEEYFLNETEKYINQTTLLLEEYGIDKIIINNYQSHLKQQSILRE